jgi:hypothetical protein
VTSSSDAAVPSLLQPVSMNNTPHHYASEAALGR